MYAGRVVIGKIAEVGRFSNTPGERHRFNYSGRAWLARRTSRGLIFGRRDLSGDGSDLCRLSIADPVNVGDEVFTGGTDGSVPLPMYHGTVKVHRALETGCSRVVNLGQTGGND